jgi:hypothetical protein
MTGVLTNVSAFPGESFNLNIPEAIGDASQVVYTMNLDTVWTELGAGVWRTQAHLAGEIDFVLTVTPGSDAVDIDVSVTNRSARIWSHSLAFHCLVCGAAPSIADFECKRHWARSAQQFRRLIEIPRKFSMRPTVQLYSVEGAPPGMQIPFVAQYDATPAEVLEGWLAIQSRDETSIAATVSKPALFLFQNMEYSCIHSGPSFGTLQPGQTGEALTRLYLARASLNDWYQRMKLEMSS